MTHVSSCGSFRYADALPTDGGHVGETAAAYRPEGHFTERHLQCLWSDDRLRPSRLTDDLGETVEVRSPGRWNLEAGPDFLDAVLLVGSEKRQMVGDVEIHIRPGAWKQHRHGDDPNYGRVVAHVTYVPGPRADDALPPHVLRIALRDILRRTPGFAFDDIDLEAYPHAVIPSEPRPCARTLGDDPGRWRALLADAGRHRLELKQQRMAARIAQTRDPQQALYEAFMAALGYKRNTRAFRLLAQRLPLAGWLPAAPTDRYARLMLAAGLLPDPARGQDESSCQLIRQLWDRAWREPVPAAAEPLPWRLNAMRPANHPARRLAVAAALFGDPAPVERLWSDLPLEPPAVWFRTLRQRLVERSRLELWNDRLTLTRRSGEETACASLLGAATAATLVTNVIVPFLACERPEILPRLLPGLPAEEISAPMRATAVHLFGRDHNPALYAASGLLQQGLLQIHADFCLDAHAGCEACGLAAALERATP